MVVFLLMIMINVQPVRLTGTIRRHPHQLFFLKREQLQVQTHISGVQLGISVGTFMTPLSIMIGFRHEIKKGSGEKTGVLEYTNCRATNVKFQYLKRSNSPAFNSK
nr:hypothetical protein Iba_scaffold875624CG0010 [Ipomoea batatas]